MEEGPGKVLAEIYDSETIAALDRFGMTVSPRA
jgi:hypothetical protein